MKKTRILIVDDHPVVREGLVELINGYPHLRVEGEAGDVEDALTQLYEHEYDLVIVDLVLPGRGGLELVKHIHDTDESMPVLVFSVYDESLYAERALRAGARGYVMKQEDIDKIVEAIDKVAQDEMYVSAPISDKMLQELVMKGARRGETPIEALSNRELEVFSLLGKGYGTRDIAETLHLSVKTIESYRANIKSKLQLNDARELVQQAVMWIKRAEFD